MRPTTAVLVAGAVLSLTTAVVGAARLRQDARHQTERNEALVARNQLDWLAQMSTNADLAKLWAPEDMDVEEYMQLLKANQLICMLSLRNRLGFIRDGHLPFFASMVMSSDVCRRYWHRFGDLRAQEAEGDERAEHFTRVLDQAAKNHPQAQPAAA
ncbi:Peptide transport system permease protein SapC [Streptomyces hygroscopicus subsp. limoneus]|nr:Peptide transport system permease protein SapC [Streptomyces hygroscopicus subsp. limoneus]